MLTYHQVQGYLQKSVALSNDLRKLKELMTPVLVIFESIDRRNEELGVDRDALHGEIKSVELLGEVLRQHVYSQPDGCSSGESPVGVAASNPAGFSGTDPQAGNWSSGSGDFVI
ncbi:MAG: hypothetical protein GY867_00490 [bacterium]|nr:hypothetical protein [bacterium]